MVAHREKLPNRACKRCRSCFNLETSDGIEDQLVRSPVTGGSVRDGGRRAGEGRHPTVPGGDSDGGNGLSPGGRRRQQRSIHPAAAGLSSREPPAGSCRASYVWSRHWGNARHHASAWGNEDFLVAAHNHTVALAGSEGSGLVAWERTPGDIFSEAGYATLCTGCGIWRNVVDKLHIPWYSERYQFASRRHGASLWADL